MTLTLAQILAGNFPMPSCQKYLVTAGPRRPKPLPPTLSAAIARGIAMYEAGSHS